MAPHDHSESLADIEFWLPRLPGGLPVNFDYRAIKSEVDAKKLILELPGCDRGRAAVELYRHRELIGNAAAYRGIMVAWDHNHRDIIEAFGSPDRFVAALRDVAPPIEPCSSEPIDAWRGALLQRDESLRRSIGPTWTHSREVACWFALHDYVAQLQPSLTPVVLRTRIDRSLIVAEHNDRTEQELIVDARRLLTATNAVRLDGIDTWLSKVRHRIADLCPDGKAFDRLLADWRRASARYERSNSLLTSTVEYRQYRRTA
ncbi:MULTISPECIES: hypothetical protein [unclassified Bradyrhizobium]|uniref:hypothetical protein n=1 Tax=unclassified Bradyrhizobium TaxID=2631580 RepID=UPI00247A397B|nr:MULTISPECIES: hypothetical protein [unclassified Bradyrhizobium]WGS18786.1 hypothetical protein MTX22_30270 [Bradyrhizobium sp. ISRA463]WGS25611.1 hypothetical protein MTX19_27845 [Bradyrhizobium sp. ISRA464]